MRRARANPLGPILVTTEEEAVTRVVEAFEESDWLEIDVRFGRLRVHLSAEPDGATPTRTSNPERVERQEPKSPADADADADASAATLPVQVDLPAGAHTVFSPSPGIFWCAPEPGAPPFTGVGQRVSESSTIGIVEVMKLMNHVKAGVAGETVVVFVGDGEAVEKGQELVAVIPDAGGGEM